MGFVANIFKTFAILRGKTRARYIHTTAADTVSQGEYTTVEVSNPLRLDPGICVIYSTWTADDYWKYSVYLHNFAPVLYRIAERHFGMASGQRELYTKIRLRICYKFESSGSESSSNGTLWPEYNNLK